MILGPLDRQLLERLQAALPLTERPFARLAGPLDADESELVERVERLHAAGIVERLGPEINPQAVGWAVTTLTASIPDSHVSTVTDALQREPGVTDLCLRRHHYNLWFTLTGRDTADLQQHADVLGTRLGLGLHSLQPQRHWIHHRWLPLTERRSVRPPVTPPVRQPVPLTPRQRSLLRILCEPLEISATPYAPWSRSGLAPDELFAAAQEGLEAGWFHRWAAHLNAPALGFHAEALWVCRVPPSAVETVVQTLASSPTVQDCHERTALADWPYNLYAHFRGRRLDDLLRVIENVTGRFGIRVQETLVLDQAFPTVHRPDRLPDWEDPA